MFRIQQGPRLFAAPSCGVVASRRPSIFPLSPCAGYYLGNIRDLRAFSATLFLVWRPPPQNTRNLPGFSEDVQRVHRLGRIVANSEVSHAILPTRLSASRPCYRSSYD